MNRLVYAETTSIRTQVSRIVYLQLTQHLLYKACAVREDP